MTIAALAVACVVSAAVPAGAQIDPLIGLKRLPPRVIVIFDTSLPMLSDGNNDLYDLKTYQRDDDPAVADALGVTSPEYRRIYRGLLPAPSGGRWKYEAVDITAIPSGTPEYAAFWAATRFEIAKGGLLQAVDENPSLVRWGLIKLRQNAPAWRDPSSASDCDGPVHLTGAGTLVAHADVSPCQAGIAGELNQFDLYAPRVAGPNGDVATAAAGGVVLASVETGRSADVETILRQPIGTGPLVPAGADTSTNVDRPLYSALVDARAEMTAAMGHEDDGMTSCRNTVVIVITSGKDDGDASYLGHDPMESLVASFGAIPVDGIMRHAPLVVIGVSPKAEDEAALQSIAIGGGGRYFRATDVAGVAAAVNFGVALGFARAADVDAGRESEYLFASPVVGTVDLSGAPDARGATLPNTVISSPETGASVAQPGNVLVTAGFALPGFVGRVRAFRTFVPTPDAAVPAGWSFEKDGTRLWPDLDGRPDLAGQARAPMPAAARNIYTFLPDGAGGGRMVSFTTSSASVLAPALGDVDPGVLIAFVRAQPLGAVIGSTPAIMGPPALDPAPDAAYGSIDDPGSFAAVHRTRRSLIFFGANDGMIHAIDARTGYEVWAFIPYNLLPKLKTLLDGQSVERFDYFVDGSPKIADVKIHGVWRTLLVIGEGYGGTFYQAFDVTEAGMGVAPEAGGVSAVDQLLRAFAIPDAGIQVSWAFPSYSSFDPAVSYVNDALGAAFPGGRVTLFGDLKAAATDAEKRVGFTFSDPAVGPLAPDHSLPIVIVGSGYFPDVEDALPGRGRGAPRAGHALFVLDATAGMPLNDPGGACAGIGCDDVGDASNGRKNALEADPTTTEDPVSHAIDAVYAGDVDGTFWRFSVTPAATMDAVSLIDTGQPILASSSAIDVGGGETDLFFGTGSDLLASTAPGGGSPGGSVFTLYGIADGPHTGILLRAALATVTSAPDAATGNGERPSSAPAAAGGIVFFTTTTGSPAGTCADPTTRVYAFTYAGGAAYDTNGDGRIDAAESAVIATLAGRVTAPTVRDRHVYIGLTAATGPGVTVLGDPAGFNDAANAVGLRVLSWREVR